MKLISEFVDYAIEPVIVEENEKGEKEYFIEGVFMQADIKNRNGRVYPKEVMKKEVDRYCKEFVEKGRAFGELGHPDGPTINLDKVSHMITKLEEDGSNFMGRAKILSTPNGQIVRNLIDDGAKLGVSADIVADPSAPEAFVEGIMEGVEWVYESGVLRAQDVEVMRDNLRNTKMNKLEETKLKMWKKFVENL